MKVTLSIGLRWATALVCVVAASVPAVRAQAVNGPLGGKPPKGMTSSITDYDSQLKYMRAFEVGVWAMPALGIYGFRRATLAVGGDDNTILAWSKVAGPNAELLTANDTTPYILAMSDLSKGPAVLEVPPATGKAQLYRQIVDMWQFAIADVEPVE
ncbi:MAG TPA: DUF1254 domain-containing protein [Acidobacteria bacterium]|nr:DUF1254 domain-containing protein [Acidobacteriota bacterium]